MMFETGRLLVRKLNTNDSKLFFELMGVPGFDRYDELVSCKQG